MTSGTSTDPIATSRATASTIATGTTPTDVGPGETGPTDRKSKRTGTTSGESVVSPVPPPGPACPLAADPPRRCGPRDAAHRCAGCLAPAPTAALRTG